MKRREHTALVTGFTPFGGETINPSQRIAQELHGRVIAGHRIIGATLPTEFAASLPALDALIERHRPALVLALGQAGGRAEISLERVAVNLIDARIADNAGLPADSGAYQELPLFWLVLENLGERRVRSLRGDPAGPPHQPGAAAAARARGRGRRPGELTRHPDFAPLRSLRTPSTGCEVPPKGAKWRQGVRDTSRQDARSTRVTGSTVRLR